MITLFLNTISLKMEALDKNENRRGLGWTSEEGKILFEEAQKLNLNESTSENDPRWQTLAVNTKERMPGHNQLRSKTSARDHLKEMVTFSKSVSMTYSREFANDATKTRVPTLPY